MPLRIDRVETEMDVLPASGPAPTPAGGLGPGSAGSDLLLRERLRPIVLEILHDELERLRRKQG